jgi:hypothetical protein
MWTKQVRNLKSGDVALGQTVDYVWVEGGKANPPAGAAAEIHFVNGSVLRVTARTRLQKEAQ